MPKKKANKKKSNNKKKANKHNNTNESSTSSNNNESNNNSCNNEKLKTIYDDVTIHPIPEVVVQDDNSNNDNDHNLSNFVNTRSGSFLFKIHKNDELGRHAIATTALSKKEIGSLILRENPFFNIVTQQYKYHACHNCFQTLTDEFAIQNAVTCSECNEAVYCSATCKSSHHQHHQPQCLALSNLQHIKATESFSEDMIRATLAYVVNKHIAQSRKKHKYGNYENFKPSYTDISQMIAHETSEELTAQAAETAKRMLAFLNPDLHCPIDVIVNMMFQINANSHSIAKATDPTEALGLGTFPLCALFNHSCFPNVIFTNEGNKLVFRLLRKVQPNEQLCVSYIPLHKSKRARQAELRTTKNFDCLCRRCNLTPYSDEDLEWCLKDKFIGGVKCDATIKGDKCSGIFVELAPSQDSSTSTTDKQETDTADTTEESSTSTRFQCSECGNIASSNYVHAIEDKLLAKLNEIETKSEASVGSIRNELDKLLLEERASLHHYHDIIADTLLTIINCCAKQHDYKAKLLFIKEFIELAEYVFPKHYISLSNYYLALIQAYQQVLNKSNQKLPATIIKRYNQHINEAKEVLRNMYTVSLGDAHPLTIAANKPDYLSDMKY